MDALALVRMRYREPYRDQLAILGALTEERARARPVPVLNSPVWLVWHLARTEDWYVNRFVVDRPQVLDEGGWPARLGVPETRVGTGLSDEEIGDFASSVDLDALRAYRAAVHERSAAVLDDLRPEQLGELLDPDRLERLFVAPDGFGERAATLPWAEPVRAFWRQVPRGWFLSQGAVIHPTLHVGELRAVASLSGWRGV